MSSSVYSTLVAHDFRTSFESFSKFAHSKNIKFHLSLFSSSHALVSLFKVTSYTNVCDAELASNVGAIHFSAFWAVRFIFICYMDCSVSILWWRATILEKTVEARRFFVMTHAHST
mmetsp:Transcript_72605/g.117754  ORF Transcript_72605/g.117754 Transcript_72605/m.117754 type:complete len:116 (+) Transcript_72605:442-789(+)